MENICYSIFNTKNPNCRCNKPIFSNNLCKYHSKRKKIIYFKEISNNKNIIITNNLNPLISSFFFSTLLFYIFFEVFFSFLRKIIQKKSPIHPDNEHLHMLSFYKISNIYGKYKGNYLNSIIINLLYLILIIPGLYLSKDPQLSRYWFFILLLVYLIIYSRLYHLTKN